MTDLTTELRENLCAEPGDQQLLCDGCKLRLKAAGEIERLDDLVTHLCAHSAAKTGDTVQDGMWDDIWHCVHPNDSSWEYPGQVIREVRAEFDRLRNDLVDVQKGYDLMREAILDIRSETSDGRTLARCDSVVTCDRREP